MTQTSQDAAPPVRPAAELRSASWFVRRALIGFFALSVFMLSGAWLLHASIDPDTSVVADESQSE